MLRLDAEPLLRVSYPEQMTDLELASEEYLEREPVFALNDPQIDA